MTEIIGCFREDPGRHPDLAVGDEVEMEQRFDVEGKGEEEEQRLNRWRR